MADNARGGDLRKCGLWASVTRRGELDVHAWRRAEAAGDIVGTCRACGGYLVPDTPPIRADDDVFGLAWFYARCVTCGHEVASPGGRLCNRSGHSTTGRR